MYRLRSKQQEILKYRSGKMGVSAVPGSGKTWTLSLLATEIILSGELAEDQEVLIVTLVNSAVDNFYQRISHFLSERGLLPNLSYRVRTLHGLAHDIVRERPDLIGLSNDFQIIDEREANSIREEVAQAWLHTHADFIEEYLDKELDEGKIGSVRRKDLPKLVNDVALSFIRYAKDMRLTPERLRERLRKLPVPLPLAEMGCQIYSEYQRALMYRGAVDFDDLIRLALQALESDKDYLNRLRYRWPYILEDEAQDSSRLQEEILKKLVGREGNWVRVGDPNQAIYESFTTANPLYLQKFLRRRGVVAKELSESGRSTTSIIHLANFLMEWVKSQHPQVDVRNALRCPPKIEPVDVDDPEPNPPDDPSQIHLIKRKYTPEGEIQAIADSLERWLPNHSDWTVAVLVPRNQRGFDLVDALRKRRIPFEDSLLRSSSGTRSSATVLNNILRYLSDPGSISKLIAVYQVYHRFDNTDPEKRSLLEKGSELLRRIDGIEKYLWPKPDEDWLAKRDFGPEEQAIQEDLFGFRAQVQRWQKAVTLPIDQIILTIAQDVFTEPTELAVAHKLAVLLRQACQSHPSWRLPEVTEELRVIARNERRFIGFSDADIGFDPEKHKGKVVVSTIHKAKGLEWDRVYLTSVNNYDFPSGEEYDRYISEPWYVRGRLNLEAEALDQLQVAFSKDDNQWYIEGDATERARLDYIRERIRLFYVGITRAKRELIITWNSGRHGDLRMSLPFTALLSHWESSLEGEYKNEVA